jgi:hypothetical protein
MADKAIFGQGIDRRNLWYNQTTTKETKMVPYSKHAKKFDSVKIGDKVRFSDEGLTGLTYVVSRKYEEIIWKGTPVYEKMLELIPTNGDDWTRRIGHMDRDADNMVVISENEDSSMFDHMLSGCDISNKVVFSIHVSSYAVQNVRELPGIKEVPGLGAVMFTYRDSFVQDSVTLFKSRWYVDSDPSWIRFVDEVMEVIDRREVDIVIF